MTAKDIQRRLLCDSYKRRTIACPNYTPKNWWECDVFELTRTGRFREYEIKLSRSDFFADAKKADRMLNREPGSGKLWLERNKHQCLETRAEGCPTQFWFVVPTGMIKKEEVPAWAGLIYVEEHKGRPPYNIRMQQWKPAPQLHRAKASPETHAHVMQTFYHRFQWWFIYKQQQAVPDEKCERCGHASMGGICQNYGCEMERK